MTPEQLQSIINSVTGSSLDDDLWSGVHDLSLVVEAMRQPITAEALTAAGWKWDPQDREYTLTIPQKWTFFYNVEYSVLQVHCWDTESSVTVRTMSNMHDLCELVRLLGGASQRPQMA